MGRRNGTDTRDTVLGRCLRLAVRSLSDVADLASGGTPSKVRPDFWQGTIPWASPKDMKRPFLYDTEDHISEAGVQDGSRLVPAGSLFLVVRGMILAKDVPVSVAMVPMAFNQDMKAILRTVRSMRSFCSVSFRRTRTCFCPKLGDRRTGTCRISTSAIERFPVPVPPFPNSGPSPRCCGRCSGRRRRRRRCWPPRSNSSRASSATSSPTALSPSTKPIRWS